MFDFFGALFGGAYLAYKLGSENTRAQRSRAILAQYQAKCKQVTDSSLEWSWREKMDFGDHPMGNDVRNALETRAQMVSEVNEADMAYVFGEDWREIFAQSPLVYISTFINVCTPGCFEYVHEVAFNIWLSQKGYISDSHTREGYNPNYEISGLPNQSQRYGIVDRAVKVIERNIKRTHPELAIVDDPDQPNHKIWNIWANVMRG